MELMQLEYFIETARREHISKTAEALNLTQPALSKSISLGGAIQQTPGSGRAIGEASII